MPWYTALLAAAGQAHDQWPILRADDRRAVREAMRVARGQLPTATAIPVANTIVAAGVCVYVVETLINMYIIELLLLKC